MFFRRRCGRVERSQNEDRGEWVGSDEPREEVDVVLFPWLRCVSTVYSIQE